MDPNQPQDVTLYFGNSEVQFHRAAGQTSGATITVTIPGAADAANPDGVTAPSPYKEVDPKDPVAVAMRDALLTIMVQDIIPNLTPERPQKPRRSLGRVAVGALFGGGRS